MIKQVLDHYMQVAKHEAERSSCLRRSVGAVAVKDDRILATGRNGQVPGAFHCTTCLRDELSIPSGTDINTCRAVHAEQNLFVQAAQFGINLKGCTIYCTLKPCFTCLKMMLSIKPLAIVYEEYYPCSLTDRHIQEQNITLLTPDDLKDEGVNAHIMLPHLKPGGGYMGAGLKGVLKGIA